MRFSQKTIALCLAVMMLVGMIFPCPLPAITSKQEEDIAKEFMKMVLRHYHLVEDPLITEYVNTVGKRIVAVIPPQTFQYHFYVVKENAYNAFAGPGGHVFINSGLLMAMENEEELAGILGHEITHVSCRHISEGIERSKKIGIGTLAGIAAGIFLGIGGASTAASAVTLGSYAAGQTVALKYSRENEIQADQLGLGYLIHAGYGGEGLLTMLKKIRNKQWFGSEQIPTYLVTHPALEDRITYITTMLEKEENRKALPQVSPFPFNRMHTRLVGKYADESVALAEFKTAVTKDPADPMAHYGYGLSLERAGNRKEAIIHLKKALEKKAFDPYMLEDLGRVYFLDAQPNEALNILKSAIDIKPDCGPEAYFYLARAYAEVKSYQKAKAIFLDLTKRTPAYDMAFYYLAEIYGKEGDAGLPHYYLGLYNQRIGQYANAVFHLKKAVDGLEDSEKREHAQSLLKEMKRLATHQRRDMNTDGSP